MKAGRGAPGADVHCPREGRHGDGVGAVREGQIVAQSPVNVVLQCRRAVLPSGSLAPSRTAMEPLAKEGLQPVTLWLPLSH